MSTLRTADIANIVERAEALEEIKDFDPNDEGAVLDDYLDALQRINGFDKAFMDQLASSIATSEEKDAEEITQLIKLLERDQRNDKITKRDFEARKKGISNELELLKKKLNKSKSDNDQYKELLVDQSNLEKELRDLQIDLEAASEIDKYDIADEIEAKQAEIEVVLERSGRLQRRMQYKVQKLREETEVIVDEVIPALVEGVGLDPEVYETLEDDDVTEEVDSDPIADAILQKAVVLQKQALVVFKSNITPWVPNDTSVEAELLKSIKKIETIETNVKKLAKTYERDQKQYASLLALGALIGLPARAFKTSMKVNDSEPKVAFGDWRKILDKIKPTSREGKDIERAKKQTKTYESAMKGFDVKYKSLLDYLPVGKGATAKLRTWVAEYTGVVTYLKTISANNAEEYPTYAVALDAVSTVSKKQADMIKKALT